MMKKTILLAVLGIAVAAPSFGQEKVVKQVERMAKKDGANLVEARSILAPALTNPETANSARAWYVAGLIEEKAVDTGYLALSLGKEINEPEFYKAVEAMTNYYMKADSLDALPNEKGKVRRKYDDKIKKALQTYYQFLVNGGGVAMDNHDFEGAHRLFKKFMDVKKMDLFAGTPVAETDSMSMQIGFFSAYAASQMPDNRKGAIAEYESIKSVPYRQNDVYQLLSQNYMMEGDTAKYISTLEEGSQLFPKENYYLFNMINMYIQKGENEKAKDYLNKVIAENPEDKQLYFVLATVYEQGFKDSENAEANYRKALEIDPQYGDAVIGLGRIYYNEAANIQSEANAITGDQAAFDKANKKAQALFEKALPYFEKAVEIEPENMQYIIALRGIYYNLKMDDKYNEIEKKIQSLQ